MGGGGVKKVKMGPDDTGKDRISSALVDIVMPEMLPSVAAPMVRPVRVMVTAVLTAITETEVSVSTMAVVVGAALVAVTVVPLIAAVGVGDVAKKPLG